MGESLFQALRENGRPTYYGENRWPVTADTVVFGLVFCFLAVAFSFYAVLVGIRGVEKLYTFIRVTVSLFIGIVILVCNFGYGWEYGSVSAVVDYKAFTSSQIKANIGLKVGLRGINITLVGLPPQQLNSTINYNERFSWRWGQGKPGYGPRAGRVRREYREAQVKGLPYPILWTVEYFTIDEGNFRHGRYYRTAGWYCHIALWTAFPLWLLSNILFFMVLRYGAYFLALTGNVLVLTTFLFGTIRNKVPVEIRFASEPLRLHYSWCFYLVLFTGFLCIILAGIVLFMDLRYPEEISIFFGIDILQDYEDFYADPVELGLAKPSVTVEPSSSNRHTSQDIPPEPRNSQEVFSLRKRTLSKRFQRSSRKKTPLPAPHHQVSRSISKSSGDLPVYENLDLTRFDPIGEEEEIKDDSQETSLVESENAKGN